MLYRKIINKLNYSCKIFKLKVQSFITYFVFHVYDIKSGKKNKFYGRPKLMVDNISHVVIGSGNVFRSSTYSNCIGLNHKCIIATTSYSKSNPAQITIGDGCGFSGATIWCFSKIEIGNNVRVGANCLIMDGDSHFDDARTTPPQPIVLEDNVFIGANCVVKKGVRIGENSVIGMNSVVTKDIPANCIAVGIPAKVIKTLS